MDMLQVNTPEELHQTIGEFLQSYYSSEDLTSIYEDVRKCANGFRVTYSALLVVPPRNDDPLDGLQEILEWCDRSIKVVDDIVLDLDQKIISETIYQLKKLRGFADSVLSLVDTKLKEQSQKEARAKVEKEYKNLDEEASKAKGMLLIQRVEFLGKLELEANAILGRETKDAVQIYLSKDPTFKDGVSQQGNEINKVLERLNELVGSDTPTGKLLDIYCKLKNIPIRRQFDDVGYAYSPIDDWVNVICGGCNRLYTSVDNVIRTFEEIQTKAKYKISEKKARTRRGTFTKCLKKTRFFIKSVPHWVYILSSIAAILILLVGDNIVGRFKAEPKSSNQDAKQIEKPKAELKINKEAETKNEVNVGASSENPRLPPGESDDLILPVNELVPHINLNTAPILDKTLFLAYEYLHELVIGGINIGSIKIAGRSAKSKDIEIKPCSFDRTLRIDMLKNPFFEIEYKGNYYSIEVIDGYFTVKPISKPTMPLQNTQEILKN